MTRICFFADGQSVHSQRWIRAMDQRGYDAVLVTRRPWPEAPIETFTVAPSRGHPGWLGRIAEIRALTRRLNPDLVHGHYVTSYGFWAATSGAHPLVLTAWGSDILVTPKQSRLKRWLTGWSLRRSDLVTADSLDVLDEVRRYRPRARLEQVQWGVDLDLFRATAARPDNGFHIVSLRSWEPLYNIDRIVAAFAELRRRRPECRPHLHLCGGGPLEAELRQQVAGAGLDADVSFHGRLDEAQLVELLRRAHVSVSVPSSDATAMSVLESMAAELPVVASDLPANRQWLDPEGGRLVPAGDPAALATALEQLLDAPAARAAMGERNRRVVTERASRQREMDRMAGLYEELLDQCRAGARR